MGVVGLFWFWVIILIVFCVFGLMMLCVSIPTDPTDETQNVSIGIPNKIPSEIPNVKMKPNIKVK